MPGCTTRRLLALVALPIAAALGGTTASASAAPSYAPEDEASITPGVMMYTAGAQYTANFVFRDGDGRRYVGYADQPVHLQRLRAGAGGQVLSRRGQPDRAVLRWPDQRSTGAARGPASKSSATANSAIRGGAEPLSPKFGLSLGDTGGGWSHTVSTLTPGIPGDSGSGFLDDQGEAIGVLSTLNIAPTPASNGVGDLGRELDHAQAHSGLDRLRLVPGTREFSPLGSSPASPRSQD